MTPPSDAVGALIDALDRGFAERWGTDPISGEDRQAVSEIITPWLDEHDAARLDPVVAENAALHPCAGCGLELDGDDPHDLCEECIPACGHDPRVRGCGGCDPGAVEFIRDDGGPWVRVSPPAADPTETGAER